MEDLDHTEVLICGAGAAGLTLAIDLARRGVRLRLIDQLPEPFPGSRGKGIQPRTQEVFEDFGVIDRIAAAGGVYPPQRSHAVDGTSVDSQEFVIAHPTPEEPYRTPLLVPQFRTEAVLRDRLAEFSVTPEYASMLTGFNRDEDGVTARVNTRDGERVIRCRYLVGGDGGRSFVRQALDIGFPGKTLGVHAIVADVGLDGLARDAWHRFNDGAMDRQVVLCPLPHSALFQLQAPIPLDGNPDLSVTGLQAFLDARIPGNTIRVDAVTWASAYSMNARLADHYRVGRVLLMGDAAHIHPPTGGQGLNTSVQDAYNLGWKLAATLNGAPDVLLDSYEGERRPIAAGVLGLSTDLLDKAKAGDMRRGREVHQLDLGYPGSPLSWPGSAERPLRPGGRMPDAILRGAGGQSRRLFDIMAGPRWTLLGYETATAAIPRSDASLAVHTVSVTGDLHDIEQTLCSASGLLAGDRVLIRPDGYVAGIFAKSDDDRLRSCLQQFVRHERR